eukprot:387351_1
MARTIKKRKENIVAYGYHKHDDYFKIYFSKAKRKGKNRMHTAHFRFTTVFVFDLLQMSAIALKKHGVPTLNWGYIEKKNTSDLNEKIMKLLPYIRQHVRNMLREKGDVLDVGYASLYLRKRHISARSCYQMMSEAPGFYYGDKKDDFFLMKEKDVKENQSEYEWDCYI